MAPGFRWSANVGFPARRAGYQTDGAREGSDVTKPLDLRLRDEDVLAEIEMTSNLMIAASESDGPLPQEQVDQILGVA